MKFKNNFKQLQEESGLSIIEIAKRTNISQDILYKMRNNSYYNVKFDIITQLCDFFNCEPGELIVSDNGDKSEPIQSSTNTKGTVLREDGGDYHSGVNLLSGISSLSSKQRDKLLKRILAAVADALDGSREQK